MNLVPTLPYLLGAIICFGSELLSAAEIVISVVEPAPPDERTASTRAGRSISESLSEDPSVTSSSEGVSVRGAPTEHTRYSVDGFEVSDPSSLNGGFDVQRLTGIPVDEIGRPALGGSGFGDEIQFRFDESRGSILEQFGSDKSIFARATIPVGSQTQVRASFSQRPAPLQTSSRLGATEPDSELSLHAMVKHRAQPSPSTTLLTFLWLSRYLSELDSFGGPGGDDPDYTTDQSVLFVGLRGDAHVGLNTDLRADLVMQHHRREFDNPGLFNESYQSLSFAPRLALDHEWNAHLSSGLHVRSELSRVEERTPTIVAASAHSSAKFARIEVTGEGGILIREKAVAPDARLVSTFLLPRIGRVFELSLATSARFPTDYQTRAPLYGNPDLVSERSATLSARTFYAWNAYGRVELGGFIKRYWRLLSFNPASSQYENTESLRIVGMEPRVSFDFGRVTAISSYTALSLSPQLPRRPHHRFTQQVQLHPMGRLTLEGRLKVSSTRTDEDYGSNVTVSLPARVLLDFGLTYRPSKTLEFIASLENSFDDRGEEVFGLSSSGRLFRVGATLFFGGTS